VYRVPYDAFLSYSHAAEERLAPILQSALHRFAKPWYRRRQLHVFRDKTSLTASPALWSSIERALSQYAWFLLMASPEAAASAWVQKEINWWHTNRYSRNMLICLTGGEIIWDNASNDFDWTRTTAWKALACHIANRNLSLREWREYFADTIEYVEMCPGRFLPGDDFRLTSGDEETFRVQKP
jgi:hypothetical protein